MSERLRCFTTAARGRLGLTEWTKHIRELGKAPSTTLDGPTQQVLFDLPSSNRRTPLNE